MGRPPDGPADCISCSGGFRSQYSRLRKFAAEGMYLPPCRFHASESSHWPRASRMRGNPGRARLASRATHSPAASLLPPRCCSGNASKNSSNASEGWREEAPALPDSPEASPTGASSRAPAKTHSPCISSSGLGEGEGADGFASGRSGGAVRSLCEGKRGAGDALGKGASCALRHSFQWWYSSGESPSIPLRRHSS